MDGWINKTLRTETGNRFQFVTNCQHWLLLTMTTIDQKPLVRAQGDEERAECRSMMMPGGVLAKNPGGQTYHRVGEHFGEVSQLCRPPYGPCNEKRRTGGMKGD